MPQIDKRQQPKTLEEAVKAYPKAGTRFVTIGGTYPNRTGTVIGITDKNASTGWLYLLQGILEGGRKESSWTLNINGKDRAVTQPFNTKCQYVKLMPGSWQVTEDQTEVQLTQEDWDELIASDEALSVEKMVHFRELMPDELPSRKTLVGDNGETAEDGPDTDVTDADPDDVSDPESDES
jgi:hypothetical protein